MFHKFYIYSASKLNFTGFLRQELARPLKWDNVDEPTTVATKDNTVSQGSKVTHPDLANLGRPTVLMLAGRDNCKPSNQIQSANHCRAPEVVTSVLPVKTEDKKLMGALALMQLSKAQALEKESREAGSTSNTVPMQYLQL